MSKKQIKHLEKARQIKAQKHNTVATSSDAMTLINTFIKNIDITKQAQSNNASNVLNALISYQKVLKENEAENGLNGNIEPIQVLYCDPMTPIDKLRIQTLSREVCDDINQEYNDTEEKETLAIMRNLINIYTEILENYDANNNLITDTKTVLKIISNHRGDNIECYSEPKPLEKNA